MDILIITGLSGSGKSQVGNILEDIGYYCIDNIPPALIPIFAEMSLRLNQFNKIAVVTDLRAGSLFDSFFECVDELRRMEVEYHILFLDANDETLARRFRETKRAHPLSVNSDSPIINAIKNERTALSRVRESADYYIDTTYMTSLQLREMVLSIFLENSNDSLKVTCISFGFKYGIPPESNIVMDVRFLANPFYNDDLKEKSGLDSYVYNYVFSFDEANSFYEKFKNLVDSLLPLYKNEGKNHLVISVGCTGGRHRSVSIIHKISIYIESIGYPVFVIHRDIGKMI